MGQIARMNRATFATLARSDQIQIPTRLLRGDILSKDPTPHKPSSPAPYASSHRRLA